MKSGKKLPFIDRNGFALQDSIEVTDRQTEERYLALSGYMEQIRTPHSIKGIEVKDTTGKMYRFPGRSVFQRRRFRQQIKQRWTVEKQEYWENRLEERARKK